MDGCLANYILFNSISVKSGRLADDNETVCNGTPLTVEEISLRARLELVTARSVGQRYIH